MNKLVLFIFGACFLFFFSCGSETKSGTNTKINDLGDRAIFEILGPEQTSIDLKNVLNETPEINTLTHDVLYQGAGIAIINIDNNDLPDLYVVGNDSPDQLYINEGNFKFKNVTHQTGINNSSGWSTGVCVFDLEGDGDDDIYVCKHLHDEGKDRLNVMYVNQGDGTFKEMASQLGLADPSFGIMAYPLDYDKDGDLDLYLINQPPNSFYIKQQIKGQIDYKFTNRLFRNDGARFTDITEQAGLHNYNYSLSALTLDYNNDGWQDIFVANDFEEPDEMFRNNGDGTFTNVANELFKHISNFSMGSDFTDLNYDGIQDIYVVDMVAEDNFRNKTNMSGMNPEKFWSLANNGYHYQYMFNTLQLSQGEGVYSEVAQMMGIAKTDWSWASQFNDVDLDGDQDLLVTNGVVKEVRNSDFEKFRIKSIKDQAENQDKSKGVSIDLFGIAKNAPTQKVRNYLFENKGKLEFADASERWGISNLTWTQGAAMADLDNDGDMDFVITNQDDGVEIYKSNAADYKIGNYIKIRLEGADKNVNGIGAKLWIKYGGKEVVYQHSYHRGFISTNEPSIHFGLGAAGQIDELRVEFVSGKTKTLSNISANQEILIKEQKATSGKQPLASSKDNYMMEMKDLNVSHKENSFNDFKREILIPYKLSSLGPVSGSADVNGDGLNDVYLGGSIDTPGKLLLCQADGSFSEKSVPIFVKDKIYEDGGVAFGDVDNDGDMDLYVSSGGNEYPINTAGYVDRLYINDGKANFSKYADLPQIPTSGSVVLLEDIDGDKDLDVFVGGRQVPGKYGQSTSSYLLTNHEGKFYDITQKYAPDLVNLGMVTDGAWIDIDGEGAKELVLCGEWMPVSIFKWEAQKLSNKTNDFNLESSSGLWNTLAHLDIDGDGDQDLLLGNQGLNYKYTASTEKPFTLFMDDFDANGTNDVYLGYYDNDGKCYPVRGRQCSSEQMPFIEKKYGSYKDFATAEITDILSEKLNDNSVKKEATSFAHTLFINDGEGFSKQEMPKLAQIAPVYDIALLDIDGKPGKEIYLIGNLYDREVETTRSDAGIGIWLSWNNGSFEVIPPNQYGAFANKDARSVEAIPLKNGEHLLFVANNNDKAQVFKTKSKS